jgi:hypothetical protein
LPELKQDIIDEFISLHNGSVLDAEVLPNNCNSLMDHCKRFPKYDSIICSNTLEHIPLDKLYDNLLWIANTGEHALFGITNHKDLIQKPAEWWIATLEKFYYGVDHVTSMNDDKFFFIECYNH